MSRFRSSTDHVRAEAKRVDVLLRQHIVGLRRARGPEWDDFRGLVITEQEVDTMLASPFPSDEVFTPPPSPVEEKLESLLLKIGDRIAKNREAALAAGVDLRLERLRRAFGLSQYELDILLIGLLPELHLKYQKLFAYAQDDITRKSPSIGLAMDILRPVGDDKDEGRWAFHATGRLLKNRLIGFIEPHPSNPALSSLEKGYRVEQRTVDYLFGSDVVDRTLSDFVRVVEPSLTVEELNLPVDVRDRISNLARAADKEGGAILYLAGAYGAGKLSVAEAICFSSGTPVLVINVERLLSADMGAAQALPLIEREALLQRARLYWEGFDALLDTERDLAVYRQAVLELCESGAGTAFLAGMKRWEPRQYLLRKPFLKLDLPPASSQLRLKMWQAQLGRAGGTGNLDLEAIAGRFRLSEGQIRDAIGSARNLALARAPDAEITNEDLYEACRSQTADRLGTLARKIQPRYGWDDIVLPRDAAAQLHELCDQVRYRQIVYEDWKFDRKVSLGKGLNALFGGPSGTGKTMAAEIIANDLKLDLYRIDLATNLRKNLDEAFARRMQFCIEFPMPDEHDRRRIWGGIFPAEAPVCSRVDLDFMARQFRVSGGNIKNIAVGAAFLAASDGGTIRMEHLIRATKREYQKIGRLCTEDDFASYFDLVKS